MSTRKKVTGIVSSAALLIATMAPTAQAAQSGSVFAQDAGQTERLAAGEMAETQGEAVCGGLCVTGVIVGGIAIGGAVGYWVNS